MKSIIVWGTSPPSQPFFGQAFVDLSQSSYAPALRVFDGQEWVFVGTLDTQANTVVPPTDGTVSVVASAGLINLTSILTRIVIVTGSAGIFSLGSPANQTSHRIVIFAASLLINGSPGSIDTPGGRPILTAPGDVAVFLSNGGLGWRLVSYAQALVQETNLQTTWVNFGAAMGLVPPSVAQPHGQAGLAAFGGAAVLSGSPTRGVLGTGGVLTGTAVLSLPLTGATPQVFAGFAAVGTLPWPVQYVV